MKNIRIKASNSSDQKSCDSSCCVVEEVVTEVRFCMFYMTVVCMKGWMNGM
jgi:hypothetical protein